MLQLMIKKIIKKSLTVNFSQFLAIKTLDLDSNPDPDLESEGVLRITVMCISREDEQEVRR
jgi:hypothetical protein